MHNEDVAKARGQFLALEDEMVAVFANDPKLGFKAASRMAGYLTDSFAVLKSENKFQSEILGNCRSRKKS